MQDRVHGSLRVTWAVNRGTAARCTLFKHRRAHSSPLKGLLVCVCVRARVQAAEAEMRRKIEAEGAEQRRKMEEEADRLRKVRCGGCGGIVWRDLCLS